MRRFLLLLVGLCGIVSSRCWADAPVATFAGEWETTYGRMVLKADGEKLSGTYSEGEETNEIEGKQEGRTFTFRYREPSVNGEGSFTLGADNSSFDGKWRPNGHQAWDTWSGKRVAPTGSNFAGVWKTSYGLMRLSQNGSKVEGCYTFSGRSTVSGEIKDGTLALNYTEPNGTTGTASFRLDEGKDEFTGTWKEDKSGAGGKWTGSRIEAQPGRVWLIILEARWEESLRDQEYSYGEMLRQFFTRVPTVAVRHRYFTGPAEFARWCEELAYLPEPVVFYVSSHGTEKGITVGSHVLDGTFIGNQLRNASSVKLVHLGACLAMKGDVPKQIRAASGLTAPVSGFTESVDWAASAVVDFAYMDLVLARKMAPAEAVKQLKDNVSFAGESRKEGSAIAPVGMKILE
jgi:hypothetical protein